MIDVAVVGAGAAGLTAAIFAARGGRRVRLLERTADGGRKILISGGGRCNVLPQEIQPERFVTGSPAHLLRGMLRSWPLAAQRRFFEEDLGVPLALEVESRKLFPASNRARDVRDALVAHAERLGVEVSRGVTLEDLVRGDDGWTLVTSRGDETAARVVLATGGLSVPATGSDGLGLRLAAGLGHLVHPLYPALTPLTAEPVVHKGLSGLSLDVRLRARSGRQITEAAGGFLFTHRGYSGPAVLDISHVAVRDRQAIVRVQWARLDVAAWEAALAPANGQAIGVLTRHLPQRLAAALMAEAGVPADRRLADLRRGERHALVEHLTAYMLPWTGDEGYKKAEVTGGGVALDEVWPQTLESRRAPGLFLCGEMLDAFGPIGGHNFAWAWATGRLAGIAAGR